MKLVSFYWRNQQRIGAVVDDHIVHTDHREPIPDNMIDFLSMGENALDAMRQLVEKQHNPLPLTEVKLSAPIPRPGKFLGVSLNYADHINETGLEKPEFPTFFTKQSTCVIAHGDPIHRPIVSEKVDYEGEMAVVIGKRGKHIALDDAKDYIAGYTIVNDVSVRDWQIRSPTWMLGKSFDTHGPMGPWLVTADEISNPHRLAIKTWVDDDLRQNANTCHMIFNCYQMISYLSQAMTLEPGDVIATGTPAGVGVKMKPRGYLKPGQTVKIEIENIGVLSNPVIKEIIN